MQGQHHTKCRMHAGGDIHQRHADTGGAAVRVAVDAHHPAHRLQHGVVAGQAAQRTVGAEAGDAAIDQARKLGRQHIGVAEAPFFHRAGEKVFDQHVCRFEQAQQHGARIVTREVERNRLLVAVQGVKVGRAIADKGRAKQARLVAHWRFDLEHRGAVVGQHLPAIGPGQHARQVEDAQAGECAGGRGRGSHGAQCASRRSAAEPGESGLFYYVKL